MPSTYTLNNGIELIATGEQSGTWGDTTNTNLELLDTALDGQVTVTLASAGTSGSPNTLPISDGAASNGRNRLVIFNDGVDLGATAYVQLTPNDAEKIIYVRNSLSGSRSILLFQGTYNASNDYEVPAGTTAIVYFNGGGTGAVAANVFNNAYFDSLRLGSVSVTAILDEDNMASDSATALATQQSIKAYVDTQVGANNELSEVLANGNTTGGTDIAVSAGDDITFADNSKAIFGAGSDLQIYHDGTSNIFAGNIVIDGSDASASIASPAALNIKAGDANNEYSTLRLATSADGSLAMIGAKAITTGAYPNSVGQLELAVQNGATTDTVLTVTSTGIDVTGTVTLDDTLNISGGSTTGFLQASGTSLQLGASTASNLIAYTNNTERMRIDSSGNVGIGTSSPDSPLEVVATNDAMKISGTGVSSTGLVFETNGVERKQIGIPSGDTALVFYSDAGSTEAMRIDSSGNVGIGCVPSSIQSGFDTLQIGGNLTLNVDSTGAGAGVYMGNNVYRDSSNSRWEYIYTDEATQYLQANGAHIWRHAASGTADTAITWSESMRIDSSGNVGIGTTSLTGKAHIYKSSVNSAIIGTSYSGHYFESQSDDATDGFEIYQKHGSNTTRNSFIVNDNRTGSKSAAFLVRGDGNVGIGTSSPSELIHGNGSSVSALLLTTDTYSSGTLFKVQGDGAAFIYNRENSFLRFGTNNLERMRIDSSGNVGIGTTSLTQGKLCINGGSDGSSIISGRSDGGNGNNERFKITAFADGGGAGYGGGIGFETRNTVNVFSEAMRIDSSGNILFEHSDFSSGWGTTNRAAIAAGLNYKFWSSRNSTTSRGHMIFYNPNGAVGTITTSGSATAYNTSSDHRLKENVTDVTDGITRVKQLEPKRFNFIADPDTTVDGFLAHEAQTVVPEAITGTHNQVDDDGNPVYQGIDQSKLVPLLTAALKEAITKIETLETEMTSVKARLDALEGV